MNTAVTHKEFVCQLGSLNPNDILVALAQAKTGNPFYFEFVPPAVSNQVADALAVYVKALEHHHANGLIALSLLKEK